MDRPTPPDFRWPPVLLAWGVLAVLFLPQALLLNLGRPEPWPAWLAALRNIAIFACWAALTPLALRAVRRWPPLAGERWKNGLRLAGVALALSLLHLVAMAGVTALLAGGPVDLRRLAMSVLVGLGATNLLMVSGLFAVGVARHQWQARGAVERRLVEARLAVLRHQLQPHFLFNTLNALAELVHSDARLAESLLLRLSALLRRALDSGDARSVSLREELDFLDDYLAIQQALLGERLRVERDIDERALDALLPPMLLQPLVENAIRHGIARLPGGGRLRLEAWRDDDDRLHLRICDDGAGATAPLREGVGLRNTRERLHSEYGAAAGLDVDTGQGRGFRIELRLPASP